MADSHHDPLFASAGDRVQLKHPPLTAVVTQIRFGEIFSIQKKEFIAGFQETIRRTYPLTQEEQSLGVEIADGTPSVKKMTAWKFADTAQTWRVTLASDFISLETKQYESRPDFRDRLAEVLKALQETIGPDVVTRTGVRYVNRIVPPQLDVLRDLLRDEIGSFSTSLDIRQHIQHSLTEALCATAEGKLLLRWGWMPEKASHDLGLMPPVEYKTWMLDIDSFSEHQPPAPFDAEKAADLVYLLASRVNTFLQWAAKDKFFEVYGRVK